MADTFLKGVMPGVQAVSLARRMAGKKGAVVQLQAEVNNEEDWEKLLTRDGLIVVDVYSDWCGPCVGMVGNLKKCKLEIGGDTLHLAVAKSDEIEVLKRFRNKSEPTWMFIAGGQLVNVMFGANAPKLMRLIETELNKEQAVMKGEAPRKSYAFDELTPEEQERFEASEALRIAEEKEEAARQLALRNDHRNRIFHLMQDKLITETVVVCMPHTVTAEGCVLMPLLENIFMQIGVLLAETSKMLITPEMYEEIFYRVTNEMSEDTAKNLALGPCYALLLNSSPTSPSGANPPEELGAIEKLVCEAINEVELEPGQEVVIPAPTSIPAQYYWKKPLEKSDRGQSVEDKTIEETGADGELTDKSEDLILTEIPGVYTPASALSKCAAITQLFPSRAEKIAVFDGKLPPRITCIFEPTKAEECFALAEELEEEVLGIGFFSKQDPEEAVFLAKTQQQYAKSPQTPENKLVVIVAKRKSEPMLSFAALGPIYVSPNENIGAIESDKFFPPGIDIRPVEEPEDEWGVDEMDDQQEIAEYGDEGKSVAGEGEGGSSLEKSKKSSLEESFTQQDKSAGENDEEDVNGPDGVESELAEGGLTPTTAVTDN